MPRLNNDQLNEFLNSGSIVLKLGTITEDGYPYVNPLWYSFEEGGFLLAGRSKAKWVEHLIANPKVSACIDSPRFPYTRVMVEADAEILDPEWVGDWEHWAHRYMGEETGHQYYEETKHMPRVFVRLNPRKITTWAGPGWHPRYQEKCN